MYLWRLWVSSLQLCSLTLLLIPEIGLVSSDLDTKNITVDKIHVVSFFHGLCFLCLYSVLCKAHSLTHQIFFYNYSALGIVFGTLSYTSRERKTPHSHGPYIAKECRLRNKCEKLMKNIYLPWKEMSCIPMKRKWKARPC